jgi:hypothetical protein
MNKKEYIQLLNNEKNPDLLLFYIKHNKYKYIYIKICFKTIMTHCLYVISNIDKFYMHSGIVPVIIINNKEQIDILLRNDTVFYTSYKSLINDKR